MITAPPLSAAPAELLASSRFEIRREFLVAVLVAFVTGLAFLSTLNAGFLRWDDDIDIYTNPHITKLDAPAIYWMFTDTKYIWRYNPLAWLGWAITYQFSGYAPFGYHFGNVLLHSINAALLVYVIMRLLRMIFPEAARERSRDFLMATAVGALFWSVHPLRCEAVSWATGRIYSQAFLFFLVSLLFYLRVFNARANWGAYAASVITFGASLLSHPAALGCPFVFVVIDWYRFRPAAPASRQSWFALARKVVMREVPFAIAIGLVMVGSLTARFHTNGYWPEPVGLKEFGIASRVMQGFYIWAWYFLKPLFPTHLSPLYIRLMNFKPFEPVFVASVLVVLGVTTFLLIQRKRYTMVLALWLCHLAILVPHLGLTEHPYFASDRYGYMANATWSVLIALLIVRLLPRHRFLVWISSGAVILSLATLTARQNQIWQNNKTFFNYILAELGNDPYRADTLFRLGVVDLDEHEYAKAEAHFKQALAVVPAFSDAHWYLGNTYLVEQRPVEAIKEYNEFLRHKPGNPDVRINLGDAYDALKDIPQALTNYLEAARLQPYNARAHKNAAIAFAQSGQLPQAEVHFRQVVALNPDEPEGHYNLALNLKQQGKAAESQAELDKANKLRQLPARP